MATTHSQDKIGTSGRAESLEIDFNSLFSGVELQPGGDGYTTGEIAERSGTSLEVTRRRIKKAIAVGLCSVARKRIQTIDGRVVLVPSYVFNKD